MSGLPLRSMPDVWMNNLDKFPNKVGAIFGGAELTYATLETLINRLANRLHDDFGIRKGDRVALAMPNCIEFLISYWAVSKAGGVVVPLNIRLSQKGMEYVFGNSEPSALIVHSDVWPTVQAPASSAPSIKHIIGVDFEDENVESFGHLIASGDDPFRGPRLDEDDLAVIAYTSGTTGVPKGAMITHGNLLFNIKNTIISHSFRHEDVHLLVVALFHCTGLNSILPTSAYQGATVVIAPRPDVRELVDLIERHRCTTFLGVPTMFYFLSTLRDLDQRDLSSLRLIAYSGSPMPPQTIRRLREKFPGVWLHNFFGLTETISITNVLPDRDADTRPESIGKVLPEIGQRILDEEGNELPPGQVGELCFHRTGVIKGYWRRPGLLEESMTGEWFRTGDYAIVDEEGYVYLKGRKKEMIIVGGENVYSLEVENVLVAHEDVLEAAVVGVEATGPHTYLGELIKAVVVPKPGAELTPQAIKAHCADRLPAYAVPHIVEFRDQLPRNPSGKVLKEELK